jgi:hypothetical protein
MFVPLRFLSVHSLERHWHRTCPSRALVHPFAWFLAHMSVWFYSPPCLHLPFCSFLVAQPTPSLVPIPLSASSDPPACASSDKVYPWPSSCVELGDSYPATTPLAYLVPLQPPHCGTRPPKSPPPPAAAHRPRLFGWFPRHRVPETQKDKWREMRLPSVHNITICILFQRIHTH